MDTKKEAENPNTVPPGEFRQVMVHNPYTGRVDAIKFVGPECFVKGMGRLDDSPKSARLTRTPDGSERGSFGVVVQARGSCMSLNMRGCGSGFSRHALHLRTQA